MWIELLLLSQNVKEGQQFQSGFRIRKLLENEQMCQDYTNILKTWVSFKIEYVFTF